MTSIFFFPTTQPVFQTTITTLCQGFSKIIHNHKHTYARVCRCSSVIWQCQLNMSKYVCIASLPLEISPKTSTRMVTTGWGQKYYPNPMDEFPPRQALRNYEDLSWDRDLEIIKRWEPAETTMCRIWFKTSWGGGSFGFFYIDDDFWLWDDF